MKPALRRKQRGAALLALAAIVLMASAYFLVTRFRQPNDQIAAERHHNARVLNQAKQALIGYVAQRAATSGENNPGRLPCPEPLAQAGVAANEGIAAPYPGAPLCASIGRLPWRTLGLDQLRDAANEPLWYAVRTGTGGWALGSTSTNLVINSNKVDGLLTVDGANSAVALIIAPGAAMDAAAAAGCTARTQVRPSLPATLDPLDYLECFDAGALSFATTGPAASFNDQVVPITLAEIMPAIEAGIAERIRREIAPQLASVYNSATWGTNVSAANPVYPFPAAASPNTLADPSLPASFNGSAASCDATTNVCRGLLPVRFNNKPGSMDLCTPAADGPLCDPDFVTWQSGTIQAQSFSINVPLLGPITLGAGGGLNIPLVGSLLWNPTPNACTVEPTDMTTTPPTPARLVCRLRSPGAGGILASSVDYEIQGIAQNVAMAMRQFTPNALTGVGVTFDPGDPPTIALNANGSATITVRGATPANGLLGSLGAGLCGLSLTGLLNGLLVCDETEVSVSMTLLPDHPLLNADDSTTGWFMRNEWYRVMYYATARGATTVNLPAGTPSCTAGTDCIEDGVNNDRRALLLLAGRSLTGAARPNTDLNDFLDSAENRSPDRVFEVQPVNRTFNDRIIAANP